jgi:hypothetical protein
MISAETHGENSGELFIKNAKNANYLKAFHENCHPSLPSLH